jgi:hypothetical protein
MADPFVTRLVARSKAMPASIAGRCWSASKRAAHLRRSRRVHHSRLLSACAGRYAVCRQPAVSSLELLHDDQPLRLEAVSDFWRRQVADDAISPALADALLQNKDSPESWARLLGRQMAKPRSR